MASRELLSRAERVDRAPEPPAPTVQAEEASWPVPVPGLAFGPLRRSAAMADPLGGSALEPEVAGALRRRRGGGAPLDGPTARRMSGAFGLDLSGVRVHTDGEADRISRSVQATAFTYGSDVYFTSGRYAPGSPAGDRLLAHELAHVAQGSAGTSAAGGTVIGRADDPAEHAADRMADDVLATLRRQAARTGLGTVPEERTARDLGALRRVAAIRRHPGAEGLVIDHDESQHADQADKDVHTAPQAPPLAPLMQGSPLPPTAPPMLMGRPTPPPMLIGGPKPVVAKAPTVFTAITPGLVNKGSEAMAKLGVNDASKVNMVGGEKVDHGEINCALVTISAIVGKQSSATSMDVQAKLGKRAGSMVSGAIQSHNLWALQLLPSDVAPLKALKLIESINDPMFPEGNAYIIGDAQFNGMLQYVSMALRGEPDTGVSVGPSPGGDEPWHVYRKGEPGNDMYESSVLAPAMEKYPAGTRFAVFVFDPAFGGGTGGHWVFAERNSGGVAFVDFQRNTASLSKSGGNPQKAVESLGQFPFLDPKETGKGRFSKGMYLAFAPPTAGAGLTFDTAVDYGEVDRELAGARQRLQTLVETRKIGSEKHAPLPGGMFAEDPTVVRLPSPTLVDSVVKDVTASLGLGRLDSRLGADPAKWNIYIAGHPRINEQGVPDTPNLASIAQLVGKNGDPPTTLGKFTKMLESDTAGGAISKQFDLSAEAKADYMWINAQRFEFTDLIHEVIHTYEPQSKSFSTPMAEGLSEVYAHMVGEALVTATNNGDFRYAYNGYYNPFRLRMENLIALFGERTVAKMYFEPSGDLASALNEMFALRKLDPTRFDAVRENITSPVLEKIDAALEELRGSDPLKHDASALAKAKSESEQALKSGGGDDGLLALYEQLNKVQGPTYLLLAKTIGSMERKRGLVTGESASDVRKRVAKPVQVTFESDFINIPKESEVVRIFGKAGELGGGNAADGIPLRPINANRWQSAPIEFLLQRGKTVEVQVKVGSAIRAWTHKVKLPDKDAVTVRFRRDEITYA